LIRRYDNALAEDFIFLIRSLTFTCLWQAAVPINRDGEDVSFLLKLVKLDNQIYPCAKW
jgi:hypothetical protein